MLCKQKALIALVGPTGVGKTELGIKIAQALGSSVVSVDARQLYRYMDIGTAKPTVDQRQQVEHHFINCINPDQSYSAGHFGRDGRRLIDDLWAKGEIPVLIGGSGFYLQALLDGFFLDKMDYNQHREVLQEQLGEGGLAPLWEELGRLDPVSQSRLDAHDTQRIVRALEVARQGAGPLSKFWHRPQGPLPGIIQAFGLQRPRPKLYNRIDQRVDAMFAHGLIDEVKYILEKGYDPACYGLKTFGYREVVGLLQGTLDQQQAKELIKQQTRQYAKRQMTWFRRDRRLCWIDLDRVGIKGAAARIQAQIDCQLNGQIALDS